MASGQKALREQGNSPTPPAQGQGKPSARMREPSHSAPFVGAPSLITFSLLFIAHAVAALNAPIQDCDEVFNFWEPTHYLNHGHGLQTWELSPVYAIRSWLYITLHAAVTRTIAAVLNLLGVSDKSLEFYGLRLALAAVAAASETRLFNKTARCINPRVAVFFLLILTTSTGSFISAASYLPSSFGMYTVTLALAEFMDWRGRQRTASGLVWLAIGTIVGWPFIAILCVPFALEDLATGFLTGRVADSAVRLLDGLARSLIVLIIEVAVDSAFFRKLSIVPLNIVLYNVFAGPGKGPDIYGTEPWYFYSLNLTLNFNIWFPLALAAGPLLFLYQLVRGQGPMRLGWVRSLVITSPLYLWLGIMTAQPHKEERFIYPVYTCIALNAAITLHILALALGSSDRSQLVGRIPASLKAAALAAAVLTAVALGAWRSLGLATAYDAPYSIYQHLAGRAPPAQLSTALQRHINVCVGKEWYRFPSSFHLPSSPLPHRLKFVTSSFHGLLPGEFLEGPGQGFDLFPATHMEPQGMNDMNQEDLGKYTPLDQCHYLVDLSLEGVDASEAEPDYIGSSLHSDSQWEIVACERFLDAARSGTVARLGWVPDAVSDWEGAPQILRRKWGRYCLLARKARMATGQTGPL